MNSTTPLMAFAARVEPWHFQPMAAEEDTKKPLLNVNWISDSYRAVTTCFKSADGIDTKYELWQLFAWFRNLTETEPRTLSLCFFLLLLVPIPRVMFTTSSLSTFDWMRGRRGGGGAIPLTGFERGGVYKRGFTWWWLAFYLEAASVLRLPVTLAVNMDNTRITD